MEKQAYTISEAAEILGFSVDTIRRAVDLGTLPTFRLIPHGALRIPKSAIDDLLAQGKGDTK